MIFTALGCTESRQRLNNLESMATTVLYPEVPRQTLTPPPDHPHLSLETSTRSAPIPNKHLPYCPPGPPTSQNAIPSTPPDTPPSRDSILRVSSVLRSINSFNKVVDNPAVYSIDAATLHAATEELAAKSCPEPKHVFPWLHGLHEENQMQLAFFTARRKTQRDVPKCFRGITIVKAGEDLSKARLRGAVSPDEVLDQSHGNDAAFPDMNPREGFCVRNFHIQVAKLATVSDIVVYGDSSVPFEEVLALAKRFAVAQSTWRVESRFVDDDYAPTYNTFVLSGLYVLTMR